MATADSKEHKWKLERGERNLARRFIFLGKDIPMEGNCSQADLETEMARKNFVRAAMLAHRLQRPQAEVRHLQELVLKQMACEYRNAIGTRKLAQEWAFSAAELESVLMKALAEHESRTDKTRSGQRYDTTTGEYLTLQQWIERFLEGKDIVSFPRGYDKRRGRTNK